MSGYRYRGKPFLSQANDRIMAERAELPEEVLTRRLAEVDKHIRESSYALVRPLAPAPAPAEPEAS